MNEPKINEFTEVMAKRSDVELIEIVTSLRSEYQLAAVEAAEFEIKSRNISEEKIHEFKEQIQTKDEEIANKANIPLPIYLKVLTFLFPMILSLVLSFIYKADGYDRKHREAWKWTIYGFGFYFGVVILTAVLS